MKQKNAVLKMLIGVCAFQPGWAFSNTLVPSSQNENLKNGAGVVPQILKSHPALGIVILRESKEGDLYFASLPWQKSEPHTSYPNFLHGPSLAQTYELNKRFLFRKYPGKPWNHVLAKMLESAYQATTALIISEKDGNPWRLTKVEGGDFITLATAMELGKPHTLESIAQGYSAVSGSNALVVGIEGKQMRVLSLAKHLIPNAQGVVFGNSDSKIVIQKETEKIAALIKLVAVEGNSGIFEETLESKGSVRPKIGDLVYISD